MKLTRSAKKLWVNLLTVAMVVGTMVSPTDVSAAEGDAGHLQRIENIQDFLGDAIRYGVLGETLKQTGDMQTNFAVKTYINEGHWNGADLPSQPGTILIGNAASIEESGNAREYIVT